MHAEHRLRSPSGACCLINRSRSNSTSDHVPAHNDSTSYRLQHDESAYFSSKIPFEIRPAELQACHDDDERPYVPVRSHIDSFIMAESLRRLPDVPGASAA